MSRVPSTKGNRRSGRRLRIIVATLIAGVVLTAHGCAGTDPGTGPTPPRRARTGFEQCGAVNLLYCNSYSIPQTLSDRVPGSCCATTNPNAAVGYLCAYGANFQAAGCFLSLDDARRVCSNASTVVRCTR